MVKKDGKDYNNEEKRKTGNYQKKKENRDMIEQEG